MLDPNNFFYFKSYFLLLLGRRGHTGKEGGWKSPLRLIAVPGETH